MLTWDELVDLQDRVEGIIGGSRVRGRDSDGRGVDGGAGSGIGSATESHWDR